MPAPDLLTLKHHRDLEGRGWHPWVRREIVGVLAAFSVLALVNLFGQRPTTATASSGAATLRLYAPTHLRGGLLLNGEPIVVVQDGELIQPNLKRERLTPDDVMEAARQQQIESLDKIRWAVLETTGNISFIENQ